MPTEKHYLVEQTDDGRFAVRAKDSLKASEILATQSAAADLASEMNRGDKPDVERVRNTEAGGRDQWRSAKE